MSEKYIDYIVNICNFPLMKPLEYQVNSTHIKSVKIMTNKNTDIINDPTFSFYSEKLIRIYLSNIEYEEQAKTIVQDELNNILNEIAFNVNFVSVGEVYFKSSNLSKNSSEQVFEGVLIKHDFSGVEKLYKELKIKKNYCNQYYNLYRLSTSCTDEIAKYMILYSILIDLVPGGQTQKYVDKFIESEMEKEGKKPEMIKNTRYNINNTIYTWLRNEIGHTSIESDLLEVRNLISIHIEELSNFAREAIIRYSQ